MIHLSASNISDFIRCSKRYYYRINYPEYALQTQEAVVGTLVHRALELYWNNQDKLEKYTANQIDELTIDRDGERTIWRCLDNFEETFLPLLKEEDTVEQKFRIQYDKDVLLVGKMDRISDGWVFDWKTGYKIPASLEADVQSIIYHYAFTRLYNKEPKQVILASLYHNKIVKYKYNELFYRKLFDEIIPAMLSRIKAKQFIREGMFNNSCDNCAFLTSCWSNGEN